MDFSESSRSNLIVLIQAISSLNCIAENETNPEMTPQADTENVQQETVGFISENVGLEHTIANSIPEPLTSDSIETMYLAKFLERPVKIDSYTWLETDTSTSTHYIEPWHLFFNDGRIKNKLNNFAFLQCTLKIKIVINASPFYYGATGVNYLPLPNFNNDTTWGGSGDEILVQYSQRPHVWLYPTGSQGAEMELPYINYRNWTRTHIIQDFKDLGKLFYVVYVPLKSANGVTGQGVTVSTFAWAENIKVSGATVGLALAQSGDEYDGVVSQPSSMISRIAGRLTSIPVIGPFALATQIGAGAISKIAHIFGYTNLPNLKSVEPIQPRPLHNFADTSISYPVDKLTVDPKCELSISQQVAGLPDSDPLLIENFISKESWLINVPWSTTNAADDILFTTPVTPVLCRVDSSAFPVVYSTPMSYVAAMFNNWRGDITFRFHIIASPFHKGRIRISWDPSGYAGQNIITDVNSYSGCFNQIVDLGKDTEVEVTIPFLQATSFLNCGFFGTDLLSTSLTPSFLYDSYAMNGTLVVRCVTALTAPVASSDVTIMVSVRSSDVEFFNPAFEVAETGKMSLLAPQSGEEYDGSPQQVIAGQVTSPSSEIYVTCFGERIVSLRQLLKRTQFVYSLSNGSNYNNYLLLKLGLYRIPPTYGYDSHGLGEATSIAASGTKGFNWTKINPMTWLLPCFVGQRGSVNYSLCATDREKAFCKVSVSRQCFKSVPQIYENVIAYSSPALADYEFRNINLNLASTAGSTVQLGHTNQGLEFQMPNMNMFKFQNTKPTNATTPSTLDFSDRDTFLAFATGHPSTNEGVLEVYCGAGPDFNLLYFINCPPVFKYGVVPTAV